MKRYFIDITFYKAKTNLEEMLHKKYETMDHCIIGEDWQQKITTAFRDVHEEYWKNGGKGKEAHFDINKSIDPGSIRIEVCTSMYIYIIPIQKEL